MAEIDDVKDQIKNERVNVVKSKLATEFILRNRMILSDVNAMLGKDIWDIFSKDFNNDKSLFDTPLARNTFIQYLSRHVSNEESKINCRGKGCGYYLSELIDYEKSVYNNDENNEQDIAATVNNQNYVRQKEILLYPFLQDWLSAQGYRAKDVSQSRALGKWGNPDICGILHISGLQDLYEIVTIEAKVSLTEWEKWIFEAVSHRRFANRVYFAFIHPEEHRPKIPQDMRYYAELFNIGVLIMEVSEVYYKRFINGEIAAIDPEEVDIIEHYSAPFNFVQPKYQVKYLGTLGINRPQELWAWGN